MNTLTPTLPESGSWQICSTRSLVSFSGRASRFAPTVRAAFSGIRGELVVDRDPALSRVSVEIDLATLRTGNSLYDDMLTAADPFRIRSHPTARFESAEIAWNFETKDRGTRATGCHVAGMLDLAGSSSLLRLRGSHAPDPDDPDLVLLSATGTIATSILGRLDLPGASLLVPKTMTLSISVTAAQVSNSCLRGWAKEPYLAAARLSRQVQ